MTYGSQQGPPPGGPGGFAMRPQGGPGSYGQPPQQQQQQRPPAGYGGQGPQPSGAYGQQQQQQGGYRQQQQPGGHQQKPGGHQQQPGGHQQQPGGHQQQQQRPPAGYNQSSQRGSAHGSTGGMHWVNATNGSIPDNAVQGGLEKNGSPLFVARAMYKGGLHPGKAAPHIQDGGCSIGWGHKEINLAEYQVLCGDANKLKWVKQEGALSVQNFRPVEAGHEETGEPLYIAKAMYEGSQQLGKCASHVKKGMAFAYGHKERTTDKYLVLAHAD